MSKKVYFKNYNSNNDLQYIVSELRNNGEIDYETTSDANNADICVTDSALQDFLWQIEGKKHFLTNIKTTFIDCFLKVGADYWFVSTTNKEHILNCMDNEGRVLKSYFVPMRARVSRRAFSSMVCVGNEIYIIPDFEKNVWVFNIKSMIWNEIVIENTGNIQRLFGCGMAHEGKVYLYPKLYPGILVIDQKNKQVERIDMYEQKEFKVSFCSQSRPVISEGKAIFYSRAKEAVVSYDLRLGTFTRVVDLSDECYVLAETYKNYLVMINKGTVCFYDISRQVVNKKKMKNTGLYNTDSDFSEMFIAENIGYMLPGTSPFAIMLDLNTGVLRECNEFDSDAWRNNSEWKCFSTFSSLEQKLVFDDVNQSIIKWQNGQVERMVPQVNVPCLIGQLLQSEKLLEIFDERLRSE